MLSELVLGHRQEILDRTEAAVARHFPTRTPGSDQIPEFLAGLVTALETDSERTGDASDSMRSAAIAHAHQQKTDGFTIDTIARTFGAVCDAITGMAVDLGVCLEPRDVQLLNLCIDDAIATGIGHYTALARLDGDNDAAARLGFLAHEMRNALNGAMVAWEVLREGRVGLAGRTSDVLDRSLRRLAALVSHTLSAARLEAHATLHREPIVVTEIVEQLLSDTPIRASVTITPRIDPAAVIDADRDLFVSALGNLLQNAIKFTRRGGEVVVRTVAADDMVRIEVEDECGGFQSAHPEEMFAAFQRGEAQGGAGLGLAIVRQAAEAHGGALSVRDIPGKGCVFALDWPRPAAA